MVAAVVTMVVAVAVVTIKAAVAVVDIHLVEDNAMYVDSNINNTHKEEEEEEVGVEVTVVPGVKRLPRLLLSHHPVPGEFCFLL